MFYYPNLNVVYCPIERTASRSTEEYLNQHDPDVYRLGNHRHSCSLDELTGLSPTKIYVSVRHPWDRLCSMYASDIEKIDSGYLKCWNSIESYLDFNLQHKELRFLTQDNETNMICPMYKLINGELIHFYRSQDCYLSTLSELNITKLDYANVGYIINESWANPTIEFPNIGATQNNASSLYTTELENKLKLLWPNDYNNWGNYGS